MSGSKLTTKTYIAPDTPNGFGVTSTIVMGESQSLLVDAQFSLSNAHRVVAEILESGRELTAVFISHMHPDHYLGLQVIRDHRHHPRRLGPRGSPVDPSNANSDRGRRRVL